MWVLIGTLNALVFACLFYSDRQPYFLVGALLWWCVAVVNIHRRRK